MPIRILVVDDHSVVRQGIITLLEDEEDLIIAGEASDGDEVWDMVEKVKPDVILLDLTMPRMPGLEVIKQIVPVFPSAKILVFSMHNNTDYMLSSALSGASGYLEKDTSRDEMLRAIRAIASMPSTMAHRNSSPRAPCNCSHVASAAHRVGAVG